MGRAPFHWRGRDMIRLRGECAQTVVLGCEAKAKRICLYTACTTLGRYRSTNLNMISLGASCACADSSRGFFIRKKWKVDGSHGLVYHEGSHLAAEIQHDNINTMWTTANASRSEERGNFFPCCCERDGKVICRMYPATRLAASNLVSCKIKCPINPRLPGLPIFSMSASLASECNEVKEYASRQSTVFQADSWQEIRYVLSEVVF
jgi:hypothetical protein